MLYRIGYNHTLNFIAGAYYLTNTLPAKRDCVKGDRFHLDSYVSLLSQLNYSSIHLDGLFIENGSASLRCRQCLARSKSWMKWEHQLIQWAEGTAGAMRYCSSYSQKAKQLTPVWIMKPSDIYANNS